MTINIYLFLILFPAVESSFQNTSVSESEQIATDQITRVYLHTSLRMLMKLFADDANIYAVEPNTNDNIVQYSLNRALDWANVWKMLTYLILLNAIIYTLENTTLKLSTQ